MGFLFSYEPNIYYSPDNVGGIPNGAGPPSPEIAQLSSSIAQSEQAAAAQMVSAFENGLHPLEEAEKENTRLLQQYLQSQDNNAQELLKAFGVQTESLTGLVGGMDANKGLGSSNDPLQEQVLQSQAKNLAASPKERPTVQDMLKLSVENSMGFLLLYQELIQIKALLQGQVAAKDQKKSGKGIGDIFKGLLEGAAGIALLAVGLMVFAGALMIFGQMGLGEWMNALAGMAAFALFVLGAIEVAKLVKDHVKDFLEFTAGVLILTAGLALFALTLILAAHTSQYVLAAIPTLLLFAAFVLGVVGIALLLTEAEPALIAFSASVLIMTAGFALFGLTLMLFAKIGPDIPPAIANLGLAMQLILGLAPFFIQIGLLSPLIALASVALAALSISLLLWTAAVAVMSLISPQMIVKASAVVLASEDLISHHLMGMFALLGLLSPLIAPGSAALLLLSISLLAWSAVLAVMSSLEPKIPAAQSAIQQSNQIIKQTADFAMSLILQVPALGVFGVAIGVLSLGLGAFADVLKKMASIQKDGTLAEAQGALTGIIDWIAKPSKDGKSLLNLLDTFSGGPFSFLTGGSVFDKLKAFGEAIKPFSEAFINLAKAIQLVAQVGSPANLKAASVALGSIIGWLIGKDPVTGADVKGSIVGLVQTLDGGKIEQLKKFGQALDPLADSMMKLAGVMDKIKGVGDQSKAAQAAVAATLSLANTVGMIQTTNQELDNSKRFQEALNHIGDGIADFTRKVSSGQNDGFDKLAKSLTTISSLNLHQVFEPLMTALNRNGDLDRMAATLERIVKAVGANPNGGLFESVGSLLNGGTQGKSQQESVASGVQSSGHNRDVDQAVLGMYGLLQKWDNQITQNGVLPGQPVTNPVTIVQQQAAAVNPSAGRGKFQSQ